MAEELFESIVFERYVNGAWEDLTPDVLHNPRPEGSRGIMNNGILDRVADGGHLTFSLDNSASNSHATLGYYSNTGDSLSAADLIRVGFQYGGRLRYKWYGYIRPEGTKPTAGTLGPRRVDVSCRGWFDLAGEYQLDFLEFAINKRIDEAIPLVIASLPASLQFTYTDYKTGDETFPTVFDLMRSETTATGEINKLTISELGYVYERGNEQDGRTLVIENRTHRNTISADTSIPKTSSETTSLFLLANGTDRLLLANGVDKLLLTETQTISFGDSDRWIGRELEMNQGEHFANQFKTSITSRVVDADATSVLYIMESAIRVPVGESVGPLRATYRDPNNRTNTVNCIAGTTPVANTDYKAYANEDGTGADLTTSLSIAVEFGPAEAEFTLTNTGGTELYTGGEDILFRFRGQGVYVFDTVEILNKAVVNANLGRRSVDFPMVYFSDVTSIKNILDFVLLKGFFTNPRTIKAFPLYANRDKKNMMAFMYLEPGTRATFAETMVNYNKSAFINGYTFEIIDGKYVAWSPCLYNADLVFDV